jgi:hypothetical protein
VTIKEVGQESEGKSLDEMSGMELTSSLIF